MKLSHIYRYPVKSMGGHEVSQTHIGEMGMPGDRAWAVKDEERNSIKGGKRFPQLMAMKAQFLSEPTASALSPKVRITLPDDQTVDSDSTDVNLKLSQAVGSPVSLWPLLPKTELDHFRREPTPAGVDIEAGLRQTFARTADEPLPDLSAFPKELFEYESPPGTYFDAYPILLMTKGGLNTLQENSDSEFDIRRFRPNLLIDLDGAFPENEWIGKKVKLGECILNVEIACPRCVMTTHGFRDLPKDPKIMRQLVQKNNGDLGVYCTIEQTGEVKVGDELEIL